MKKALFVALFLTGYLTSSVAQVAINIPDITTLRSTAGSVGMVAIVAATNQNFTWNPASNGTDNGINTVRVTLSGSVIPGAWLLQLAEVGNVPISVTSVTGTSEVTVFSKMIKGNILGTGRAISYLYTYDLSSGLSLLPNITIRIKYGSSVLTLVNAATVSAGLTRKGGTVVGRIVSDGSTNAQKIYGQLVQDNTTGVLPILSGGANVISNGALAVDSTVDQMFSITVQISNTNVTMYPMISNVVYL